jgi:CRISPR type III-B/RAMP module RAMP protein Cmr6
MSRWTWPLPKDVCAALVGEKQAPTLDHLIAAIDNPALLLQGYVPFPSTEQIASTRWQWNADQKGKVWNSLLKHTQILYRNLDNKFWKAFAERQQELATAGLPAGGKLLRFPMRVTWRLSIGLGVPHPLETGITLHHLYGVPYLPGSAVKAVTRAWRLHAIAREIGIPLLTTVEVERWKNRSHGRATPSFTPLDALDKLLSSPVSDRLASALSEREKARTQDRYNALAEATQGESAQRFFSACQPPIEWSIRIPALEELLSNYVFDYSRIFGSQQAEGELLFFDAYPSSLTLNEQPILELDVMTPHHTNYYAKGGEPKDRENPVPVKFPVIAKDTEFIITLGCLSKSLLDNTADWVRQALQDWGIGAKTRAGYGELESVQTDTVNTLDLTPGLGAFEEVMETIDKWGPKDMGQLETLVQRIAHFEDPEVKRKLVIHMQKKLIKAKRWKKEYEDKPWYQILASSLSDEN